VANLQIQEIDGGVVFGVKVVPGSSRTAVVGVLDGMVKIKVMAAAEKGKANKQLIDFLAKVLGVKTKAVSIMAGHTNPVKNIKISGISSEELQKKFDL
jgi:uncharacterized protein (TIGR00251 family)